MKRVYDSALAILNEEIYQHDFISLLKQSKLQLKNGGRAISLATTHGNVNLVCLPLSSNTDFMPQLSIVQELCDKIDLFFAKPNNQRAYTDHEALLNNSKKLNDILMKKSWFIESADNSEALLEFLKLSNISLDKECVKKFFSTCYQLYANKLPHVVGDIEKAFQSCHFDRSYNMDSHTLYKEDNTIYFSNMESEVKIVHVQDTYVVFAPYASDWELACVLHHDQADIPKDLHFSTLEMLTQLYEYMNNVTMHHNKKINMK